MVTTKPMGDDKSLCDDPKDVLHSSVNITKSQDGPKSLSSAEVQYCLRAEPLSKVSAGARFESVVV